MRDPELMQRADRAAITLEQAWERWRDMHGLGNEPLPPVSSYVGYSLEEPWGQPRVVFGLRADEAELLASQLEGHDCTGPIYPDARARPDWRRPVAEPVPDRARPYSNPVSVPAQGLPPAVDQTGPEERTGLGLAEAIAADDQAQADSFADGVALGDAEAAVTLTPDGARGNRATRGRKPRAGKAVQAGESAEARQAGLAEAGSPDEDDGPDGAPEPSALMPLPDISDSETGEANAEGDEAESGRGPRPNRPVRVPAQGPGYRGPRYQGFPPRYDPSSAGPAAAANVADEDDGDDEPMPAPSRRPHVTKLSRNPRRRAGNG